MHALGMVHLDLSLENMLMNDEEELKVIDFGLTRHLQYEEVASTPATPAHQRELPYAPTANKPGKFGYMSPEIFSYQPYYGTASDVWSMGVILFISLFGVPPFQCPAPTDQRFVLISTNQIMRLLTAWNLQSVVSAEGVDLIQRMLLPQDQRFTIEQILQHPWISRARPIMANLISERRQQQEDQDEELQTAPTGDEDEKKMDTN